VDRKKWYKTNDLSGFITPKDFIKNTTNINYENPLMIILCAYLYRIKDLLYGGKLTEANEWEKLKADAKSKSEYPAGKGADIRATSMNFIYIILFMGVVTRYISTIVNQGNGIVTTLEHLKYYFLYNTKDRLKLTDYNKKISEMPLLSPADKENRQLHNKGGQFITGSKMWTNKDDTGMVEMVENGMFQQYKILEVLAQYATKKPELTLGPEGFGTHKNDTPNHPEFLFIPSPSGNKYIMLTAILRGKVQKDGGSVSIGEVKKYCMATKNTLDFAHSITSIPGPCTDGNEQGVPTTTNCQAGGRSSRKRSLIKRQNGGNPRLMKYYSKHALHNNTSAKKSKKLRRKVSKIVRRHL